MEKTELINDILADMISDMDDNTRNKLRIVLTVRLQHYDLIENRQLPSTEVKDNEWVIRRFMVDCAAKGLKQSSIRSYIFDVRKFFDQKNLSYAQVVGQDITDYLAVKQYTKNAKGEYPKQNYIAGICRNLFVFFTWAYKKHHIPQDIMLDVDRVKAKAKKKDRLSPEEIEACREHAGDEREKALFELMICTGMRVGEICQLKIEDVNLTTREIRIRGYKSETSDRDGVLSIKARNEIVKYIGKRRSGYLFSANKYMDKDAPLSQGTVEHIAKSIGRKAGAHLTTTVHVYRKTFASELFRKTHDVKLVSIMLGHADTRVTEQCYLVDDMADIKMRMMAAA